MTRVQAAKVQMRRFASDTSGATAIEYALIAGGIAVAIVSIVNTLGSTVTGLYTSVVNKL